MFLSTSIPFLDVFYFVFLGNAGPSSLGICSLALNNHNPGGEIVITEEKSQIIRITRPIIDRG